MGPLNDALVHIGFNKPELFRVLLNDREREPQAAVVSITRAFDFPPLNGSVNPADGQLYIAGFQMLGWGTTATRLAGLGRVRYTGAPSTLPREVVPMDKGVLLRFDVALDPARARIPDSYSLTSWNYQRTYQYGSPQYKADGTPGIDRLTPSSAYLSQDGRSVFVGVPGMKPVDAAARRLVARHRAGRTFEENAYFTPYELATFDPRAEGFGDSTVDLVAARRWRPSRPPVSAEEGRRLSQLFGCIACHATENTHGLEARPDVERPLRQPAHVTRRAACGSRPTKPISANPSSSPRRRSSRVRTRRGGHAELCRRADRRCRSSRSSCSSRA